MGKDKHWGKNCLPGYIIICGIATLGKNAGWILKSRAMIMFGILNYMVLFIWAIFIESANRNLFNVSWVSQY